MELSEKIVEAIRARYMAGATYTELSEQAGVSSSYIRHILNGKRDPMKLSLDFFLRLFPSARIELAPARVPDDPAAAADVVSRSEYQDLRDRYQDLRDQYQDLREQLLELRGRPSFMLDGPGSGAPYIVESTSSPSNK